MKLSTCSEWFIVPEHYRQKAKHYGLFLSSQLKIACSDESDKAKELSFHVYFTWPRQTLPKRHGGQQNVGLYELTKI